MILLLIGNTFSLYISRIQATWNLSWPLRPLAQPSLDCVVMSIHAHFNRTPHIPQNDVMPWSVQFSWDLWVNKFSPEFYWIPLCRSSKIDQSLRWHKALIRWVRSVPSKNICSVRLEQYSGFWKNARGFYGVWFIRVGVVVIWHHGSFQQHTYCIWQVLVK